ncbi:MAG: DUF4268 domain-containing protein [Parvibaculales bacterium]
MSETPDGQTRVELDKLVRVALRDIWTHEAQDFTPWLAQEENLTLLGNSLDMELVLKRIEANVGSFSADILCTNADDDTHVLIENQLENTNHVHLGQLMTYAAGLEAANIIWIAAQFRDEHRAALDWLNDITEDGFRFFGLEIELWRIGDSKPAPKFNIVCKPNDWSRAVKSDTSADSATKRLQLEFWTQFKKYIETKNPKLVSQKKPGPRHYLNFFCMGKPGTKLITLVNTKNGKIGAGFETLKEDTNRMYDQLFSKPEQKDLVNKEIGAELDWRTLLRGRRVWHLRDGSLEDTESWPEYFAWMHENLEKFYAVFSKIIEDFDAAETTPPTDL